MTQRIDWEALGKAAGEAERNTKPGLKAHRPARWRPGMPRCTDTYADLGRKGNRVTTERRRLAAKLDAVLGKETDE